MPEDPYTNVTATRSSHPLRIFDLKRRRDAFVYACAPMVRYSKLAFRQTCHTYGVDICWTPMILAKEFNRNEFARNSDLTICTAPSPSSSPVHQGYDENGVDHNRNKPECTIIQFGANSALELSRAASLAAPWINGVDLNCGCPQSWACAETLGAALMNKRELVRDMVIETRQLLRTDGWDVGMDEDKESAKGRSVSVKIRVHDDLRKTMDWIDTVIGHPQNRNIDWITIHPRTRTTPSTKPIRTEALEILTAKYSKTLPVLLSGDVFDISALPFGPFSQDPLSSFPTLTIRDNPPSSTDFTAANPSQPWSSPPQPSTTGISGFMSARGLLCNPALFAGHTSCPWEAVETFMCKVARAPLPFKNTVHHISEMVGPGMASDKNALLTKKERSKLSELANMVELIDYLDEKIDEKNMIKGGLRRDL